MNMKLFSPNAIICINILIIPIFFVKGVFNFSNVNTLDYKSSGYYDSYEPTKTTLIRQNKAGHPECRFTFEVRIPNGRYHPGNLHQKNNQLATVCIYWGRGGFGAYDLETSVHLHGNGLAKKDTLQFPLRHLGPCTLNGNVLSDQESYAFGYILGREFNGMIYLFGKNYFIESHDKVADFRFNQNATERILSKVHSPLLFPEIVSDPSMIFNEGYRVKRATYEDGDDSIANDDGDDADSIPQPPVADSEWKNSVAQDSININTNKDAQTTISITSGISPTIPQLEDRNGDIQSSIQAQSPSQVAIPSVVSVAQDKTLDNNGNFPVKDKIVKSAVNVHDKSRVNAQRKNFRVCKVTLVADSSFFWAMGRGNEASTTGRMLYYLDFVDSFLTSQNWTKDSSMEAIGLQLEKIHIETSLPNADSKLFTKLVTHLKTLPQYINGNSGCLTIAFTATATPYEFNGINKETRICAGAKFSNGLEQKSFNDILLINTVGKDGTEIPGSEIIRTLLQAVLISLGGNSDSPDCDVSLLREKFFSNALRNLSIRHCIRDQISQTLSNNEHTHCLQQKTLGVCNGGSAAFHTMDKCDCGYRSYCLSADKKCCISVHTEGSLEKPFRQCSSDNIQSKCREPMGICSWQDSVCRLGSNYVNGSLGEKYAVGFSGMGTDSEDGTSHSEEIHFRSVSSVVMAILWHSMFNFLFHN